MTRPNQYVTFQIKYELIMYASMLYQRGCVFKPYEHYVDVRPLNLD